MFLNLRQRPDAARPNACPSSAASAAATGNRSIDLTDRQIESYMLRHSAKPSPILESLYAAVRHQMTLDGCP
jgi:hypothetical protein